MSSNNSPCIFVEEGGILAISTEQLSATDIDTKSMDLILVVEATPSFGILQKDGDLLTVDKTFNLEDLRKKRIR
jgi:hypothetical protein